MTHVPFTGGDDEEQSPQEDDRIIEAGEYDPGDDIGTRAGEHSEGDQAL